MSRHPASPDQKPAAETSAPEPKFQVKKLLGLLRLTKGYKKDYAFTILFLILQIASYQLLTYSLQFLINDLFPLRKVSVLVIYAVVWIGLFSLHGLVTILSARYRVIIVRSLVALVRSELIAKLQVLSLKYFDARGTGATSAKLLMDVDKMQNFFDWLLNGFLNGVITVLISIPFLSSIDPLLTVITFIYVPTIPLIQRIFWKVIMRQSYQLRNSNARLSEKLVDYISGMKHIRMFASEEEHGGRIMSEVNSVKSVDIKYTMIIRIFMMIIQFFNDFMPVLLWVAAGILMIYTRHLTMGAVVAYVGLVRSLLNSIQTLFSSFDQVVNASPSVSALMEIIQNEEVENPNPQVREFVIDGSIELKDVNFSYETRAGQRQLSNISLSIRAGESVALVGESGSGKSTLANVLLGLYPIQSGSIRYGAYNLDTLYLKALRSQIAIMSQETFLFNTTLHENIRFARLDATKDDIIDACKKAQIYDFIESLPEKLETCAGERGLQISGGQRQRIGLARVFLRNPKIIILDEPSSSLDIFTEQRLFETLFTHLGKVTLIIIAHRLSTIKDVGRIFVFKEGRIIEQGDFASLCKGPGIFGDMVRANTIHD